MVYKRRWCERQLALTCKTHRRGTPHSNSLNTELRQSEASAVSKDRIQELLEPYWFPLNARYMIRVTSGFLKSKNPPLLMVWEHFISAVYYMDARMWRRCRILSPIYTQAPLFV
jgi:hypothetical protein